MLVANILIDSKESWNDPNSGLVHGMRKVIRCRDYCEEFCNFDILAQHYKNRESQPGQRK